MFTITCYSTTPPEKPTGSNDTTQGNTDTTSQATPTDGSQGAMPDMLTLTGETTTITLSDAITLSKMSGRKMDQQQTDSSTTAAVSDITVGSILKISYGTDATTIESIEIMTMPQATGTTTETTV